MQYDVLTIGSATRDVYVEGNFPIVPWKKVPSGNAYALPRGEKLDVSEMFFTVGGNSANAAVTFARQGMKVSCVARVGDDPGGREALKRLKAEGVATDHVVFSRTKPTSYSILILEKGERTILNYKGASHELSLRDVPTKQRVARWWYLSLPGDAASMFPGLIGAAHRLHMKVGFNPTGYELRHRRAEIVRALPWISFLVMNDEEASWLTGLSFKKRNEMMRWVVRRMGPAGIFAMTLGPEGSWVAHRGKLYRAGTFKEKSIEDRTGAGDSWGAGFVAGLLHAESDKRQATSDKVGYAEDVIRYAIRLASANATANVEHIGATEGTLTRREFERNRRWNGFKISAERLAG